MNTDQKQQQPDLHGASNTVLLLKEETHAIIGCAFEVLNGLGHGLDEKCYENAFSECRIKPQMNTDGHRSETTAT